VIFDSFIEFLLGDHFIKDHLSFTSQSKESIPTRSSSGKSSLYVNIRIVDSLNTKLQLCYRHTSDVSPFLQTGVMSTHLSKSYLVDFHVCPFEKHALDPVQPRVIRIWSYGWHEVSAFLALQHLPIRRTQPGHELWVSTSAGTVVWQHRSIKSKIKLLWYKAGSTYIRLLGPILGLLTTNLLQLPTWLWWALLFTSGFL